MDDVILKGIDLATLVVAVMIHEVSHGAVALWCGDPTAKEAGRLSLNPVRHVDLVGTIILPVILAISGSGVMFGWAKPVPVNISRCRNPRQAFWLTAIAGPLSNLIQALIGVGGYYLFARALASGSATPFTEYGIRTCGAFIVVNIVLMTFNLVPIPPLDGSKVVAILLPARLAVPYLRLENVGFVVVFLLLQLDVFDKLLEGVLVGFLRLFGLS